jgi:hypothetical protein
MFDWFAETFDVTLLATVGLIFFLSLLGAYIRARRRDPCLKSFVGYPVTLEQSEGHILWGTLELEATGLELRYKSSVHDAEHVESSYVFYAEEFANIQAIYRYADELTEEHKRRRLKDLRRSFHPGIGRRIVRNTRNFISLASESLSQVIGVIVGGLRTPPAGRYITDTSEEHLQSLGTTFISHVGNGYDPLLENYIGQKMVFELVEGDEVHEHVGIFKQYSADFIEILDVQFPQPQVLPLGREGAPATKSVRVERSESTVRVINNSHQPVLVHSLSAGAEEELLNVVVDSGETVEVHPRTADEQVTLNLRVVRDLDMIVPRTRCRARHRAEFYQPSLLPSFVFDLGVMLSGKSKADVQEQKLRDQLAHNPNSVLAMVNLGAILMQKKQFAEAERLLRQAWKMRYSLPDNGRRTHMLLEELERHQMHTSAAAQSANVESMKLET